ncbi:ABC transporter permease [Parasegetibacter sp. NRK P23]|uniref:ABC transporter permease n=1 Tax=Parasegetibacter sp. NRK P23 TaxID=2942999 RepID=UPI0020440762|nr:ABC transporter permease [Parasegetibacter sp. NRK P23]MCM5530204.1 ABC transporter permease [Parasegetibacter sp. NRK P23]
MYFTFAWRYFRARKSTQAINVIAWVCVTAIAVGAAALIIILSAFNGFEDLVKSLYASFYTDIKVSAVSGKVVEFTPNQLSAIQKVPGVAHYTRIAEEKALVQNGDYQQFVSMKGVDEAYQDVTGVAGKMFNGKFNTGTADAPGLVLGAGIENSLAVNADRNMNPLTVYMVRRTKSNTYNPMDLPLPGYANTSGAFLIQQDFDNKYVLTNLDFVRRMMGLSENQYTALEIKITEPGVEDKVKKALSTLLGDNYKVQTRFEQNQSLFSIMQLEKWVIYGILTLIMIIAAFNIVGALMMLVLEKQKDIHVLKALGAHDGYIRKIFLSEGILLAGVGTLIGSVLAIALCWAQIQFKLIPLEGGSFIIDYYPVKMIPGDFLLVVLTIFTIAVLAAWIPARKAAKMEVSLKG